MTHPVTTEELHQIVSGCAFPQNTCEECKNYTPYGCTTNGALSLMDEVLSRPDPLALLEAYTYNRYLKNEILKDGLEEHCEIREVIKRLEYDPEAVREQGIKEGWLHD